MENPVPNFLTHFYRSGCQPFQSICDLEEAAAEELLKSDVLWRGDGTYLTHRKWHEAYLRARFIDKGGVPKRQHPIYMILGDSPAGPHDLRLEYPRWVTLPLSCFPCESISFTYPDSLYKVPLDDLGRLYLERDPAPLVYTMEELPWVIKTYQVYEINQHYVEAQVWDDAPLQAWLHSSQY